ncbi:MAG: hypothetical protein IPG38_05365 [Chitinophagaceae bacterium]|nr:hypothetical protein [Chitinophagaceae bacterium]
MFYDRCAGKLWIGTRGDGIIVYDPVAAWHKQLPMTVMIAVPRKNLSYPFKDRQGIMWRPKRSGLAKFDPLKFQFHAIVNEPSNPASLPDNMIFDMYKTRDGHYYVGTQNQGIAEWDVACNRFHTYSASSKIGVVSNTIYDITEDDNNNLWIASWGGLMQLDRKRKLITYKENNELPASKKLYGIIKLKQADSLFITGENGSAFFFIERSALGRFTVRYPLAPPVTSAGICMKMTTHHRVCTVGAGLGKYDYRRSTFEVIEPVKKYAI